MNYRCNYKHKTHILNSKGRAIRVEPKNIAFGLWQVDWESNSECVFVVQETGIHLHFPIGDEPVMRQLYYISFKCPDLTELAQLNIDQLRVVMSIVREQYRIDV